MIISIKKLESEYGIRTKGILHIGSHEGQEYREYASAGVINMIFFEPVKSNYEKLLNNLTNNNSGNLKTFNIALGNETGEKEMFIETANKGMSCSILEPSYHLIQYPWIKFETKEIVKIDKLDNICYDHKVYNIINVDVQGYELEVFKGSVKSLKYIDAIFTEINNKEMYKGCPSIIDIDIFLVGFNFIRVTDNIIDSWGDVLYVKNKFVNDINKV
jgi:FkbM family methyltransferase